VLVAIVVAVNLVSMRILEGRSAPAQTQ
jgi:hypothetical protein